MKTYSRRNSRLIGRKGSSYSSSCSSSSKSTSSSSNSNRCDGGNIMHDHGSDDTSIKSDPHLEESLAGSTSAAAAEAMTATAASAAATAASKTIARERRRSDLSTVPVCSLVSTAQPPHGRPSVETYGKERRYSSGDDSIADDATGSDGRSDSGGSIVGVRTLWGARAGGSDGIGSSSKGRKRRLPGLANGSAASRQPSIVKRRFEGGEARGGRQSQTFLDFGQNGLGKRTHCPRCNLLYVCGDEEDEARHTALCAKATRGVEFNGWKQERVKARYTDDGGRVVEIRVGDPTAHLAKLTEVERLMDADMGFAPGARGDNVLGHTGRRVLPSKESGTFSGEARSSTPSSTSTSKGGTATNAFLYVRGKRVLGCVIAQRIESARRALPERCGVEQGRGVGGDDRGEALGRPASSACPPELSYPLSPPAVPPAAKPLATLSMPFSPADQRLSVTPDSRKGTDDAMVLGAKTVALRVLPAQTRSRPAMGIETIGSSPDIVSRSQRTSASHPQLCRVVGGQENGVTLSPSVATAVAKQDGGLCIPLVNAHPSTTLSPASNRQQQDQQYQQQDEKQQVDKQEQEQQQQQQPRDEQKQRTQEEESVQGTGAIGGCLLPRDTNVSTTAPMTTARSASARAPSLVDTNSETEKAVGECAVLVAAKEDGTAANPPRTPGEDPRQRADSGTKRSAPDRNEPRERPSPAQGQHVTPGKHAVENRKRSRKGAAIPTTGYVRLSPWSRVAVGPKGDSPPMAVNPAPAPDVANASREESGAGDASGPGDVRRPNGDGGKSPSSSRSTSSKPASASVSASASASASASSSSSPTLSPLLTEPSTTGPPTAAASNAVPCDAHEVALRRDIGSRGCSGALASIFCDSRVAQNERNSSRQSALDQGGREADTAPIDCGGNTHGESSSNIRTAPNIGTAGDGERAWETPSDTGKNTKVRNSLPPTPSEEESGVSNADDTTDGATRGNSTDGQSCTWWAKVNRSSGPPPLTKVEISPSPATLPSSALVCEEEEIPAWVGILQVWVHEQNRREGVATRLVDTVREKMVYGFSLRREQMAFSQPTREGQAFATRYTGGKLLVY